MVCQIIDMKVVMSISIYFIIGLAALVPVIGFILWLFIRRSNPSGFYTPIEKALQEQDFQSAKKLCLKRIDSQPNDFVIKYYLGQALEGLKDFTTAILYYEKAAISASTAGNDILKTQIHLKTALLFKKMHNDKEALGYFALVLDREPQNSRALFACGEIYNEFKNYEKAIKYLESHLAIKPDHIRTRYLLGEINMTIRKYPEAIEQFEFILENEHAGDDVIRPKIMMRLTEAYLETKNYDKAKDVLQELMKDDDYFEDAVIKMVQIKIKKDEIDDALNFINLHINNLSPANKSLALYHLGNVYYKKNKYVEAVSAWRKAYEINPGNKDLKDLMSRYSLIVDNPKVEGLYTDDMNKGEVFIHNLMKNDHIKDIVKQPKYWIFLNYDNYYVIYRVPQPIPANEITEIKAAVKKYFIKCNSFNLYTLFGLEFSAADQADSRDLILVSQRDLLKLINANIN